MSKSLINWPMLTDDTPVVRISGFGSSTHDVQNVWVDSAAFQYMRTVTRHLWDSSSKDSYVGCIFRPDKSLALFSVGEVDRSVNLQWKPEDDLRRFLETEDSKDSAVQLDAGLKYAPKVSAVPDRGSLPDQPPTLTIGGGSMEPAEFGAELVRRMRSLRGMSRSQLAERLAVAPSRIAELESAKGPQGPTLAVIKRVADACEIDLDVSFRPRRPASK